MLRFTPRTLSAVAAAVVLSACSDSTTAPSALDPHEAVVGVLPTPTAGSTAIPLATNGTWSFCGTNATLAPTNATVFAGGGGSAFNLTTAIAAFNPGWPAPIAGSSWIGPQADANEYRVPVGASCYRTTFNVPAGSTNRLINLRIMADNVAIVYLNGTEVGRHTPTMDNQANFNSEILISDAGSFVSGVNTLTIHLINTKVGYPGDQCASGPPPSSAEKLPPVGTWSVAECRNPSALSAAGAAYYVPAPPQQAALIPVFVIGDVTPHAIGDKVYFFGAQWDRNNSMSGEVSNGIGSFKGYATESSINCGGTWEWVSRPGNSSNPPGTIADRIAVIVTTKVIKAGQKFKGDIHQIVLVDHDGNYGGSPGQAGKGTVAGLQCPVN